MTIKQTPQMALMQKLQQELQNDQLIWFSYPDITKRARQATAHALFSSWIILRIILFTAILLVALLTRVISQTNFLLPLIYGGVLLIALIGGIILILQRKRTVRRHLQSTLYAITTRRLVIITLDRDQFVQNSYYPSDLGRIDLIERGDGWGDIVIGGLQRFQSRAFSLSVISPRLSGVAKAREVASLLIRLKTEQYP